VRDIAQTKTKIMLNIGDPSQALKYSFLPNDGVGLVRIEFIIASLIGIHPMALVRYKTLPQAIQKTIDEKTAGYVDKPQFFVDKLAEGIGMIAAAFYPKDVIVRFSDFKTNEYANLVGGAAFEPKEENPMLGFRGACRYYSPQYKDGFALECQAILRVRKDMGLSNVKVMVPFCRTIDEGKLVIKQMSASGLDRGQDGLEVYVMCEVPSNVIQSEGFSEVFDGMSIGSNDLTQLILGIDRSSEQLSSLFDERHDAVKQMIKHVIATSKKLKKKVGICGQAPSDYPEFVQFLVEQGIDSISLNPDAVMNTRTLVASLEMKK
jgi:pyruvate,water dikinase